MLYLKLYLAGPMRGIEEYNFPAFRKAARELRARGHTVFSPADHDVKHDGFNPKTDAAKPLAHYMRYDLPAVCRSDAVVNLDGWEKSTGACLENFTAAVCDIPSLSYPSLARIEREAIFEACRERLMKEAH